MSDMLLQHTENAVHTITLNRPDIRNAFNDVLIGEIREAFDAVSRRTDVRCVVLTDRKSTRLNSSHVKRSRMPSSA